MSDARTIAGPAGTVEARGDRWYGRVRLAKGRKSPWVPLGPVAEMSEDRARDKLAALVAKGRAAGKLEEYLARARELAGWEPRAPLAPGPRVTFGAFAKSWTSGELHRTYPDHVKQKRSADDDEHRLEKHVIPIVGDVALVNFTLDDAEKVMRKLPASLSAASRRQVAQTMHRLLGIAVFPARIIPANPLPRGFLPSVGPSKALAYLYPDEDAKLLGGVAVDEKGAPLVPLSFRLLYGFLAREGMRAGEAAALTWRDVDLERGVVALDDNKTDDPRAWALAPGTTRALAAWKKRRGSVTPAARVFVDEAGRPFNSEKIAKPFRAHLKLAGVDRAVLFVTTATRRQIRIHDLRATFVTVSLANGRTEAWVQDRTGHRSSVMLNRYRRAARSAAELGLGPLADLDAAIPELAGGAVEDPPEARPTTRPTDASSTGSRTLVLDDAGAASLELRELASSSPVQNPLSERGCRFESDLRYQLGSASEIGRDSSRETTPEAAPVGRAVGRGSAVKSEAREPAGTEAALAIALERASAAGRWDVVAQLARELEARRERGANVVALDVTKKRRG